MKNLLKRLKKKYDFFRDFGIIFQMTFRPTYNCSIAKIQKLGERWLSKLYVGSLKVPDLLFFHATICGQSWVTWLAPE